MFLQDEVPREEGAISVWILRRGAFVAIAGIFRHPGGEVLKDTWRDEAGDIVTDGYAWQPRREEEAEPPASLFKRGRTLACCPSGEDHFFDLVEEYDEAGEVVAYEEACWWCGQLASP